MRTLRFGDRSISYDVGLDTIAVTETNSEQERKVSVASSESADSGVGDTGDQDEDQRDQEAGERRVIRPDDSAVRQLLNFDEEEEDGYEEEDSDSDDNQAKETDNHDFNDKWRQTVVKDLTRWQGSVISRSDSLDQVLDASDDGGKAGVKLSLKEIGHIRRVLARAEMETDHVSSDLRYDLDNGRVCGVCTVTRFGVLTRGWPCDLCSVVTCSGCIDTASRLDADTVYNIGDIPRHLLAPSTDHDQPSDTRHNCAGSAPNSPSSHRRHDHGVGGEPLSLPPLQPPPVTSRSTLPRRWSMMVRPRHQDNITLCLHCKNMIKQILRTKGYNSRSRT